MAVSILFLHGLIDSAIRRNQIAFIPNCAPTVSSHQRMTLAVVVDYVHVIRRLQIVSFMISVNEIEKKLLQRRFEHPFGLDGIIVEEFGQLLEDGCDVEAVRSGHQVILFNNAVYLGVLVMNHVFVHRIRFVVLCVFVGKVLDWAGYSDIGNLKKRFSGK